MPPPMEEQVRVVREKSAEEIAGGTTREFMTRDQMDAKFGRGGWRPLIRFAT